MNLPKITTQESTLYSGIITPTRFSIAVYFVCPLYSLISSRQNSVRSTKTAEIHRIFTYFDFPSSSHLFGPIFPPKLNDIQCISAQLRIIPKFILRIRNSDLFLKPICNCSTCCSLPVL